VLIIEVEAKARLQLQVDIFVKKLMRADMASIQASSIEVVTVSEMLPLSSTIHKNITIVLYCIS